MLQSSRCSLIEHYIPFALEECKGVFVHGYAKEDVQQEALLLLILLVDEWLQKGQDGSFEMHAGGSIRRDLQTISRRERRRNKIAWNQTHDVLPPACNEPLLFDFLDVLDVAGCSQQQQEVLTLAYAFDASNNDIALTLGISVHAVHCCRSKALKKIEIFRERKTTISRP